MSSQTRPSNIITAKAAVAVEQPGGRIAGSRWVTFAVIVFELLELATVGMIADYEIALRNDTTHYIDHGFERLDLLIILGVIQYVLIGLEILVKRRTRAEGFTIPLGLLPFGRAARFVLMVVICLLVMVPKLLIYFLYMSVGVPFIAVLARLGITLPGRILDILDSIFEPLEWGTNRLYNLLYFNKIEKTGSVFNTFFNLLLTPWCLNH